MTTVGFQSNMRLSPLTYRPSMERVGYWVGHTQDILRMKHDVVSIVKMAACRLD